MASGLINGFAEDIKCNDMGEVSASASPMSLNFISSAKPLRKHFVRSEHFPDLYQLSRAGANREK